MEKKTAKSPCKEQRPEKHLTFGGVQMKSRASEANGQLCFCISLCMRCINAHTPLSEHAVLDGIFQNDAL